MFKHGHCHIFLLFLIFNCPRLIYSLPKLGWHELDMQCSPNTFFGRIVKIKRMNLWKCYTLSHAKKMYLKVQYKPLFLHASTIQLLCSAKENVFQYNTVYYAFLLKIVPGNCWSFESKRISIDLIGWFTVLMPFWEQLYFMYKLPNSRPCRVT